MNRPAAFIACLTLLACFHVRVAAADKKTDERYRVTYDIRDLVDKRARQGTGKRPGPLDPELVLRLLVMDHPDLWTGPEGSRSTIEVVNECSLDVFTTHKGHTEIDEALAALRRLHDVSVNCVSHLYEVDADYFNKTLRPMMADERAALGLHAVPVGFQLAGDVQRKGRRVKPIFTEVIANGDEASIFSWRLPHFYRDPASTKEIDAEFSGLAVTAAVVVSGDRRSIELRLEQRARNHLGSTVRAALLEGNRVTFDVPKIGEVVSSETATVDDGECLLAPVHLKHPAKDKVYVLFVQAGILVKAEQDFFLEHRLGLIWSRLYRQLKIQDAVSELDRIPGVRDFIIRWLDRAGQ